MCKSNVILEGRKDMALALLISDISAHLSFYHQLLEQEQYVWHDKEPLFPDRLCSFSRWLNSVMQVPTTKKLQTYRTKCAASEVRGM